MKKQQQQTASTVTDKFKLRLIEMALHKLSEQLENHEEFKASPNDLIRLIEAHNAMQKADGPSEVLVRWINREADSPKKDE